MAGNQHGTDSRPEIPNRLFFRIGEVTKITGVEAHVLRFWESEFPMLSPSKTPKGQRQYRRKDLETVLSIKQLLYGQKYTIAGARQALRARKAATPIAHTASQPQAAPPKSSHNANRAVGMVSRQALAGIRGELEQILKLLEP